MIPKRSLTINKILTLGVLFALPLVVALPGAGRNVAGEEGVSPDIEMVTGDIENIKVKNLSRLSLTDPEVADISDAKTDEVIIMAKTPGQTVLFLWDDLGKRSLVIRVVAEDLGQVKARILKLVQKADIAGVNLDENAFEGRVVVTGELEKEQKEKFEKISEPFNDKLINLVKEKVSKEQIQIDMQITELSTTLASELGINWKTSTSATLNEFNLAYKEDSPVTDGSVGDFFKIADFNRTSTMIATVNAFIQEGKGRILSKPRLVVVSGKEASFLVGGEIPFNTTSVNSTGGNQTTETTFKQYGVNMTLTPTIIEGKIEIDLNVEVSDLDPNRSGAFITRNATTHLNLNDKQTIVLAGLIKKSTSEEVKRVPYISKIPILGLLFRSKSSPKNDTELVISLTPTILKDRPAAKPQTSSAAVAKAPAAVSMGTLSVGDNAAMSSVYAQALQNRIASSVSYPYEAKENGWEGTVKLRLRILKDGTLADVSLVQSSGYDIFDQDAINTAKLLAPYSPFSSDMNNEDVVVVVPIAYHQQKL